MSNNSSSRSTRNRTGAINYPEAGSRQERGSSSTRGRSEGMKRFRWRCCESMWMTVDLRLIFQPAEIATNRLVDCIQSPPPAIHPRRVRLHIFITRNDPRISKEGVKSSMHFWWRHAFRRSQLSPLHVWEVGEVCSLYPSFWIVCSPCRLLLPGSLEKGKSGSAFFFLKYLLLPLFCQKLLLEVWG